jgi:hypothetical protein
MSSSALGAALDELARQLDAGDLDLGVFDDAQIAAVTPATPATSRLVPLTVLDALDPDARESAIQAARESLVELGYLEGDPPRAVDELAAVLELRSNPSAIVVVDHMSRSGGNFSMYLYGIGSAGYLVEAVRENEHAFRARSTSAIVAELVGLIDPRGDAAAVDSPQLERKAEQGEPPGWNTFETDVAGTHTIVRMSSSRKVAPDTVEDSLVSFAGCDGSVWGYSSYVDEAGPVVAARSLSRRSIEAAVAAFLGVGLVAERLS